MLLEVLRLLSLSLIHLQGTAPCTWQAWPFLTVHRARLTYLHEVCRKNGRGQCRASSAPCSREQAFYTSERSLMRHAQGTERTRESHNIGQERWHRASSGTVAAGVRRPCAPLSPRSSWKKPCTGPLTRYLAPAVRLIMVYIRHCILGLFSCCNKLSINQMFMLSSLCSCSCPWQLAKHAAAGPKGQHPYSSRRYQCHMIYANLMVSTLHV